MNLKAVARELLQTRTILEVALDGDESPKARALKDLAGLPIVCAAKKSAELRLWVDGQRVTLTVSAEGGPHNEVVTVRAYKHV